jgi:di/tripeptidase
MERNYELLKEVLSVPTKTYKEDLMIQFIADWLTENNIPFYVDEMYNIYATKQTDEDIEYFPCVIAHTDTVHTIDTINVVEEMLPNAQGCGQSTRPLENHKNLKASIQRGRALLKCG